ncbi:squalene/phytoene synthase family protein [Actinotalea sp. K2]|uniref:phytoene/squalene synthase family protein n=1 Tax=Actinotalea sp. K2 TaxID=2939438 RepID=UPI002016EF73|nr:squalene/phytoene synthase family protein [Actinotalea sp. K2]MCL3859727.1 squalene/phytoene synthase family protein [Actinotalea sp. K2]
MSGRLNLYDRVAEGAADLVVREYSTSFGLATRLLPAASRVEIRNIYALVRLADEVVDGATEESGGDLETADRLLTRLEAETTEAIATGYSTNVLVHAFAGTARRAGFGTELTTPFFTSMRMDLQRAVHDAESFVAYVHGSAEVVGLMCLRVFLLDEPAARRSARYDELAPGACALGAAFQKINFLRDLADDHERLGRSYFVDVDPDHLSEEQKAVILADIREDLRVARAAMAELPPGARRAVQVASALFTELTARLAVTPAADIARTRVRVPGPVKVRVAAQALRPRRAPRAVVAG